MTNRVFPILLALVSLTAVPMAAAQSRYVNFESGPVRPLALSPDGTTLFVVNIPDARLEILDVTETGLEYRASVLVGLDPVAVVARSNNEVWVVNHLSDSVSVVDVSLATVTRTLLVGDEPRDIVFAGSRAFITTAHRGQHRAHPSLAEVPGAGDPQFSTPGIGRADVWVFDGDALGDAIGGTPIGIVTLFGDTPRALAVSPDQSTVYVGVFNSGNRTTVVHEGGVCDGFDSAPPCAVDGGAMPGGNPGPAANIDGVQAPEVGLIVQYDDEFEQWLDELGRDWSPAVRFDLPDYDVFAIDALTLAEASPPVANVGTTLFNMTVNPVSGALYVSNTDSHNEVRFEGPGATGGSTVQGDLARARITIVSNGAASPRHLNKHINYSALPAPPSIRDHSLATPLDMAISSDGSTLYVAGYGSSRVGVFPTTTLDDDSFDPTALSASYITTSGGGPAGLALDESVGRLYVYTRFDNAVAAVDLSSGQEVDKLLLPSPEPDSVVDGRPFLYNATLTSSNGEASCASCHIFAGMDHLAWDLGNPDDSVTTGPITVKLGVAAPDNINGTGNVNDFHPMKGPMTTQTLRGLQFSGAQHWRGDRSVGPFGIDPRDSELSFNNFIVAFPGLVGRAEEPTQEDMQRFTDFAMTLALPPNPVRNVDNSLTAEQQAAFDFYTHATRISDGVQLPNFGFNCNGCHQLDRGLGRFGTSTEQSFENESQIMKIAQLRNLYQKVGMFGMLDVPFINAGGNEHLGPQVRGFGYLHDGSIDTIFRFFSATVFDANGADIGFQSDIERRGMESLMLAFDSDLAPAVGQQITLTESDDPDSLARLDTLVAAAGRPFTSKLLGGEVTECELIAKVHDGNRVKGFLFDSGVFIPDDDGTNVSVEDVIALADQNPVTFTAVVPGTGERLGIDRDGDDVPDGVDPCPLDPNADECSDLRPTDPPGGGGCGCRAAGPEGAATAGLVLVLCLFFGYQRTRRRIV